MSTGSRPSPASRAPHSPCPACGGVSWAVLFDDLVDRVYKVDGRFIVYACEGCGLRRLWPVPADLAAYYPDAYFTHTAPQTGGRTLKAPALRVLWQLAHVPLGPLAAQARALCRRSRVARELLLSCPSASPRLLDIGCGGGAFLQRARGLGLAVAGVDADEAAVAAARSLGLDCRVGDASSASAVIDGRFDVVRLGHVFEHLEDPAGTLADVAALLAPRGRLVLLTPNAEGALARAFGRDWFQLDPPRHLWGWGPGTLRRLLESAGYTVLGVHHLSEARAVYHSFRYAAEAGGETLPMRPRPAALDACDDLATALDASGNGDSVLVVATRD